MPFKSEAQRRYLFAKHPDIAREFAAATPKGKKLPEHVKQSHDLGVASALERFGFARNAEAARIMAGWKFAGEELRLKIPERKFHGFDAAVKTEADRGHKKADCGPHDYGDRRTSEALADMLMSLDAPPDGVNAPPPKDKLDRSTMWGPPSNLAAGDTAGRMSDMGQPTGFGGI